MLPPPAPTTYTITSSAGEGGTISPLGETSVTEGSNKTYTITPDEGYEIFDVLVNEESVGVLGEYIFTDIQQNHTIVALFVEEGQDVPPPVSAPSVTRYTITASAGLGGTIDPEGAVTVNRGGSQTFTITAFSPCYEIGAIVVDGDSIPPGIDDTYTFNNVQKNHTIEVVFNSAMVAYNTRTNETYTAIHSAIFAAEDDTIIVCPGFHDENIVIANKNINLQSIDPLNPDIVENTIISAFNDDQVVVGFADCNSSLKGFTIQGGSTGISIFNSPVTVTIANNIIKNNDNPDLGGGIFVVGNPDPVTIIDNIITGNQAQRGGGISVSDFGDLTISGNIIENNTASKPGSNRGGGIAIRESNGTILIHDNIIKGNSTDQYGGGIYMVRCGDDTTISLNKIEDNAATFGGGIYISEFSPNIIDNQILGNSVTQQSGGIHLRQSQALITGNLIEGNDGGNAGGGIRISESNPTVENNTFNNNHAEKGGGIFVPVDNADLLPADPRPTGWGDDGDADYRQHIPPYDSLPIAGNTFSGNSHTYHPEIGNDVWFTRWNITLFFDSFEDGDFEAGEYDAWTVTTSGSFPIITDYDTINYDNDYAVHMGDGAGGLFEGENKTNTASIERTVTIPADALYPELSIYYRVIGTDVKGEDYDWMKFFIGDDEIFYVWEDSSGWEEFTYDLSAYIGESFVLKISAWTQDHQDIVNYYVDHIEIKYE